MNSIAASSTLAYLKTIWPAPGDGIVYFRTDPFFYDIPEFPRLYAFGEHILEAFDEERELIPLKIHFFP